jgi:cellulose synthase/poly-beta-1,6-N-acetylglucosamine synthase-like glycosyltransferase
MIEYLFISAIFLIFYAYVGYPVSLYIIGFIHKREVKKTLYYPDVTIIITAHNEENRIERKIKNTLEVTYPREKLQIMIVSDGSTDNTVKLAGHYRKDGIEILAIETRKGKENAQKEAVLKSKGNIIVFTDVATILDPSGIEQIVSNFADPKIGCVSSEDRLTAPDGKPGGEGFYVRYEMWLRRLEARVNSLVGLSGSFFAARKSVCQDFSGDMQSDFRTLLNCVKMGLRGVCDPNAPGYYQDITDRNREFGRKVRTVLRGLTVFFQHMEFLNIFKYGVFSYQYFCHKLLRWLVPIFLCVLFISNLIISFNRYIYFIIFLLQLLFYVLAIYGLRKNNSISSVFLKIPTYFLTVNTSIIVAWWQYIRGQRVVMWTPSERL